MTCIVGIEHDGRVYIGGDSAGVAGWLIEQRADEKVWSNSRMAFGFTTSFRMGQILRYSLHLPAEPEPGDESRWMATEFIAAIRKALTDGGYTKTENGREEGGTFLVGWRGKLFVVADDFQVGRPAAGFTSVGCGNQLALGALHASQDKPPAKRLRIALEAAERFSAGVCGPFEFVSTDPATS